MNKNHCQFYLFIFILTKTMFYIRFGIFFLILSVQNQSVKNTKKYTDKFGDKVIVFHWELQVDNSVGYQPIFNLGPGLLQQWANHCI